MRLNSSRRMLLGLPLLGLRSASAIAQAYPARPVRVILPFAAGGGTDVMTRVIAEHLGNRMGQRFLVENITGAGGNIGTERVIRSAPDGYTLLLSTMSIVSINPALYRNMTIDIPNDLMPVSLLLETPQVVVVNPNRPWRSLEDVAAAGRAAPRTITFASAGAGTSTHLYGELFKHVTGADIVHVPYRGNGPALADVIAGHVDMMFDQLPNSAEQIRSGRVRALAVTSVERMSFAPDVPNAAEAGMPGLMGTSWSGMSAPRGTPPDIIAHLNAELQVVLALPELKARLEQLGATARGSTVQAYGELVSTELTKWTAVIRAANLSANQ
ncbi:MAG: tripartite tricarboxylate transporter substrate binding protein [Rubritepida sp.]|nr:tripartite tricarboxylate transporter substrate binding protein [Rubritepida sp.]